MPTGSTKCERSAPCAAHPVGQTAADDGASSTAPGKISRPQITCLCHHPRAHRQTAV
jgi:hypothetical protein